MSFFGISNAISPFCEPDTARWVIILLGEVSDTRKTRYLQAALFVQGRAFFRRTIFAKQILLQLALLFPAVGEAKVTCVTSPEGDRVTSERERGGGGINVVFAYDRPQ